MRHVLSAIFVVAAIGAYVYLRARILQKQEAERKRKIHVQTLFPDRDRHLSE